MQLVASAFESRLEMFSCLMSALQAPLSAHQRPMPVMHAHVCHRVNFTARGSAWQPKYFTTRRPALRPGRRCPVAAHADGQRESCEQRKSSSQWLVSSAAGLWLLGEMPAFADTDFSQGSFSAGSYYVSLGLFLVTLPGMDRGPPPLLLPRVTTVPRIRACHPAEANARCGEPHAATATQPMDAVPDRAVVADQACAQGQCEEKGI